MTPLLSARAVTKAFGSAPALRGVDLDIVFGEVLAVMGPSGSGKSTLMHCLAGILLPDSGEVQHAGRRLDRMTDGERSVLRRTEFGFVFQFGQLVPELSAVENVALPLLLARRPRREALRRAREQLGLLGLHDTGDRTPGELSGGQSQRVAIARALVVEPQVVFADEPTGALDTLTGEQVMESLTTGARERGATVVLVTHDPRVAAYADREIVVRDGLIAGLPAHTPHTVPAARSRSAASRNREQLTAPIATPAAPTASVPRRSTR